MEETNSAMNPMIEILKSRSKQAALHWLEGCREACCLHRVVILCHRSRPLLKRTGQCFMLNWFIFLGRRILLFPWCGGILLRLACRVNTALFWFYPLYLFSFTLSTLWYSDIPKDSYAALGKIVPAEPFSQREASTSQSSNQTVKQAGIGGIVIGIGEQIYSMFLLTFFFLQVYATGFVPYIGKTVNFILLAWMFSYYCFEYKRNLSEVSLEKRLAFFESNWAFFAGFSSPCVVAIFFVSPLVSYGVVATSNVCSYSNGL